MRQERVATARAIQREHDQLDPTREAESYFGVQALRLASQRELELIAQRLGIDCSTLNQKGIIAEILTRQAQLRELRHNARKMKVEQGMERITHLADRLREILPPGMTLGDYFGSYKQREMDKRKARRIDEERRRIRRIH